MRTFISDVVTKMDDTINKAKDVSKNYIAHKKVKKIKKKMEQADKLMKDINNMEEE